MNTKQTKTAPRGKATTAQKTKLTETLLPKASPASSEAASHQLVPLGSLAYTRPAYLAVSAWTEHIPFAFWLIETLRPSTFVELGTHYGVSYFAFCQALEKLDFGAQAFAVDQWTGDEHSGLYGPEVFEAVKARNDELYSHFSTLKKSSFDDASGYFPNGSIDLLHIDGLHTYEAVRHDFEKWLPKMSSCGVVIFHDTNVRERNFGVFRLFDELKENYPSFEFTHGHGLGVVGVGSDQNHRILRLFGAERRAHRDVRALFSSLGRGCIDAYRLRMANQNLAIAKTRLDAATKTHQQAAKQTEEKVASLLADLQKKNADAEAAAFSRSQAEKRAAELEEEIARHKNAAKQAHEKIATLSSDLQKRIADAEAANAARKSAEERVTELSAEITRQREAAIRAEHTAVELRATIEKQTAELQYAREQAEAHRKHWESEAAQRQKQDADGADEKATRLLEEQGLLRARVRELEEECSLTHAQLTDAERRTGELQEEIARTNETIVATEEQRSVTEWLRGELEEVARTRQEQLNALHEKLLAVEQSLATAQQQATSLAEEKRAGDHRLEEARNEADSLRNDLSVTRSALAQRQHETEENADEIRLLRHKIASLSEELHERREAVRNLEDCHKKVLADKETEQNVLQQSLTAKANALSEEIEAVKQDAEKRVRERFEETAALTQLLKEAEAHSQELREKATTVQKELEKARQESVLSANLVVKSGGVRDSQGRQSWEVVSQCGTLSGLELGKAILGMIRLPALWRLLPAQHQLDRQKYLLLRSGLFDAEWYLAENNDVAAAGVDPAEHYIRHGAFEGREPNRSLADARRSLSNP